MSGNSSNLEGLFPVNYQIGTGLAGAPSLALNLLVYTPGGTVSGAATIGQAVNPPVDVHSIVWGNFTYMMVIGPGSRILVTAEGNPSGESSGLAINFKLHLVLSDNWQSGVASYQYLDGGGWHNVDNVPAHSISPTRSEPYPPIVPLYGVSLQEARNSGNLAQMKALAAQARQTLDNLPQIEAELGKLQTLIG